MKFLKFSHWVFALSFLLPTSNLIPLDSDEMLAIRRIAACYHEKDFELSKKLIADFFKTYPSSEELEYLYILLGDIYFKDRDYSKALTLYEMASAPILKQESLMQKLHCYYFLKKFSELEKAIDPLLNSKSNLSTHDKETLTFYYAEALYGENEALLNAVLSKKIISLYQSLLKTSLEPYAKLNLAQIYAKKKDFKKASKYFEDCADAFPDQKEKLLFLAAQNQSEFDPKLSSNTFYEIKELNRSKSSDALYNWMVLLFHSENFDEILKAKDEILNKIPKSKVAYANSILGKVFFNQKKYNEAISHFKLCLDKNSTPEKEPLFLSLLSSFHLEDIEQFNAFFNLLEKHEKSSKEFQSALFLKGKLCQKQGQYPKAQSYFNRVIKSRSAHLLQAATFEFALCHFLQDQFQKSHDFFSKFLSLFEEGEYLKPALYYQVLSTSKLFEKKPTLKIKEQLIQDYVSAVDFPGFFEPNQLPKIHLKIARLYLDIGEYSKLFSHLEAFMQKFEGKSELYQAHLLMALGHKKNSQNLKKYIEHLQKASLLQVPEKDLNPIYLHLFQAYFQLAKENQQKGEGVSEHLSLAAKNLDFAIQNKCQVPKEHFLWLAQFYFDQTKSNLPASLSKSSQIFERFLKTYPKIDSLEDQYLRFNFAEVLDKQSRYKEKIDLLENLIQKLPSSHPLYIHSKLQIGIAFEKKGEHKKAAELFEEIISKSNYSIPVVTFTAKLHLARLLTKDYLLSPSEELYQKISHYYHDLHLGKSFKNEPLHLEAALDHALLQNMDQINNQDFKPYLNALKDLKESFLSEDNLVSKEYHEMRKNDPQKNKVFEDYMLLIDAKILHLQSKINRQNNEIKKADENIRFSKSLLERLESKMNLLTPYLKEVTYVEKEAIDQKTLLFDFLTSYISTEASQ